jgi:hypothetical protein
MLKPEPHSDEQPEDDAVMQDGLSFEELMMLVFSGPMCFECLEEAEIEEEQDVEVEEGEDDVSKKSN